MTFVDVIIVVIIISLFRKHNHSVRIYRKHSM